MTQRLRLATKRKWQTYSTLTVPKPERWALTWTVRTVGKANSIECLTPLSKPIGKRRPLSKGWSMRRTGRSNSPFDYHDPTAGIGGAPPARSALGLRLVLASFGLVVCSAGAVAFAEIDKPVLVAVIAVLAAVALVDIVVVIRRQRNEHPEQK